VNKASAGSRSYSDRVRAPTLAVRFARRDRFRRTPISLLVAFAEPTTMGNGSSVDPCKTVFVEINGKKEKVRMKSLFNLAFLVFSNVASYKDEKTAQCKRL